MAVRIRELVERIEKLEAEVAELRKELATKTRSASKPKTN